MPTETWGGSSCIGPTTTAAPHTGKYVFTQTELPVNGPDSIVYGCTSTTTEDVGPYFTTYCVDKTPISTITPAQAIPTAAPQPSEYIYSQTVQPIDGDTAENILIGCTSTTIQSGYWETNTVCVDSTPLATSWATPTAAPAAPQTAPLNTPKSTFQSLPTTPLYTLAHQQRSGTTARELSRTAWTRRPY